MFLLTPPPLPSKKKALNPKARAHFRAEVCLGSFGVWAVGGAWVGFEPGCRNQEPRVPNNLDYGSPCDPTNIELYNK